MTTAVRDARPGDEPAIADVLRRSTRSAYTFMAWPHEDSSYLDFVRRTLPGWSAVRLAESGGRVVGFACLEGDILDQLFVDPDWQGRGVGSTLLDDAKALRPGGMMLYTFEKNTAARGFYERRGFVEAGRGFSQEEQEPDILYAWSPDGG